MENSHVQTLICCEFDFMHADIVNIEKLRAHAFMRRMFMRRSHYNTFYENVFAVRLYIISNKNISWWYIARSLKNFHDFNQRILKSKANFADVHSCL